MLLEHGHGARVEGDDAVAGFRLRGALFELPADLNELLLHSESPLIHIEVHPAGAAALAAAEASERDEVEQRVQPVLGGYVQERSQLDRRPDHDGAGPQLGGLPHPDGADLFAAGLGPHDSQTLGELGLIRLDPLLRPHQRLRPLGRLQLDRPGVVDADDLLADRVTQHRAEGCSDALLRGRAGDPLPAGRRPHLRVVRLLRFPNGFVLLVDHVEDPLQDGHPQPVHADMRQVLHSQILAFACVTRCSWAIVIV
ncbi:hypothetical protein [Nonomuraea maritima]|uniref:hypothetical protein n=1 Tax=Nonomuraea maritima TaxID=683260 RepID=UPI0015A259BD